MNNSINYKTSSNLIFEHKSENLDEIALLNLKDLESAKTMILRLIEEKKAALSENDLQKKIIASLQIENEILKKEKEKLIQQVNAKVKIIKKLQRNEFGDNQDTADTIIMQEKIKSRCSVNTEAKEKGKTGRKVGSKNYSNMDLEVLSSKNEVIRKDNYDELVKKYPNAKITKLSERVGYVISMSKPQLEVQKVIYSNYKIETVDENNNPVVIFDTPKSESVINHSFVGSSLLANLISMKYTLGVPTYRYKEMLEQYGLKVNERTLYGWISKGALLLKKAYQHLIDTLTDGSFENLNIDETWFKNISRIKFKNRKKYFESTGNVPKKKKERDKDLTSDDDEFGRETVYIYVISGKSQKTNKKLEVFLYSPKRSTEVIDPILAKYNGAITTDRYSGYRKFGNIMPLQYCWEHLRRLFYDILKGIDLPLQKDTIAFKAADKISKVLNLDAEIDKIGLTPKQVLEERHKPYYTEVVNDMRDYLDSIVAAKDSPLYEAIEYYKNGGEFFYTFLKNGAVPLTNNEAERLAKRVATVRKNSEFVVADEGGENFAMYLTLTRTAEVMGLYPDEYIKKLFDNPNKDIEELMPWNNWMREGIEFEK